MLAFGLGVLLCLLSACQQSKDKQTPRTAQSDRHQETADAHTRTGTEEVHALLILLGNDRRIRDTVNATESQMLLTLTRVSKYCKMVNLTLMKSETETRGRITQQTLQNGKIVKADNGTQGPIITSYQVADWVRNLKLKPEDTVLIYYNGHGRISGFGRHTLQFDPEITGDTLDRGTLSEELEQKPARLRMLITDTCSETIDAEDVEFRALARTRDRKRNYMEDLFLGHAGFLDITAASPGEVAIGNPDEGGHFTYALFTHGCAPGADKNNDDFITWKEAFDTTEAETNRLFKQASPELNEVLGRRSNRQKTQKPVAHSLPQRITTPPDTITSTAPFIRHDDVEMMRIPAGKFQMGSSHIDADADENPVHQVYVDTFYIDKYEVTNAQYKRFVDANPQWQKARIAPHWHDGNYLYEWNRNTYPPGKGDHPVRYVNWHGAVAYAQWVGKRLPTEAEWEKAARGGFEEYTYPWGDTMDFNKTNLNNRVGDTTPVGQYPANGYGLHDMCGNIREWCLDQWDPRFYNASPLNNPVAGESVLHILSNFRSVETLRVLRDGSWANSPRKSRIANRNKRPPTTANRVIGFRCARSAQ